MLMITTLCPGANAITLERIKLITDSNLYQVNITNIRVLYILNHEVRPKSYLSANSDTSRYLSWVMTYEALLHVEVDLLQCVYSYKSWVNGRAQCCRICFVLGDAAAGLPKFYIGGRIL